MNVRSVERRPACLAICSAISSVPPCASERAAAPPSRSPSRRRRRSRHRRRHRARPGRAAGAGQLRHHLHGGDVAAGTATTCAAGTARSAPPPPNRNAAPAGRPRASPRSPCGPRTLAHTAPISASSRGRRPRHRRGRPPPLPPEPPQAPVPVGEDPAAGEGAGRRPCLSRDCPGCAHAGPRHHRGHDRRRRRGAVGRVLRSILSSTRRRWPRCASGATRRRC